MKKLFLLPVLFFLVLTSCIDDEEAIPKTISQQVKGTWVTTNQEYKYFDASGQLVHEETDKRESIFKFDGSTVVSNYGYGTGTTLIATYTISRNNGKNYINLTELNPAKSNPIQQIEITSITGSAMSWSSQEENAQFFHNGLQTADHVVVTATFKKE